MLNAGDIDKLKIRSKSAHLLNIHEWMQRHSACWCVRIRVCVFQCVRRGTRVWTFCLFLLMLPRLLARKRVYFFFKINEFDVSDTENMHCARWPDAQDDRICSYYETSITCTLCLLFRQQTQFRRQRSMIGRQCTLSIWSTSWHCPTQM